MKRFLLPVLAFGFGASAFAYNYGRWLAPDVDIPINGSPSPGIMDFGSAIAWLKAENSAIIGSGPTATNVPRWIPNDLITICNGSLCETWIYRGQNTFAPIAPPAKDNGRGYKNGNVRLQSGTLRDWDSIFSIMYQSMDYSTVQPYQRVYSVEIRPAAAEIAGFGATFSMGFDWGAASTSEVFNNITSGTIICMGGCRNVAER